MKKYFFISSLILLVSIILIYGLMPDGVMAVKRILKYKYYLSLTNNLNDMIYEVKLKLNNENEDYPTWKVNTSKKNYVKIQNQLTSILEGFVYDGATGSETLYKGSDFSYPSDINNELNSQSRADLKLFGMYPDHYGDPSSHSFRLKYKNALFFGKKRENFIKPIVRDHGIDYLFNVIFSKHSRGIKIDYNPVRILFNNIDYGFYYREPFFDKYLIELNGFRDGEIFEIYPDSIKINHLPESKEFTEFKPINSYDKDSILSIIDKNMIYDIVSIAIISGSSHSVYDINLHWYHNPVINKIQPTLREIKSGSDISSLINNGENDIDFTSLVQIIINDNSLIKLLYENDKASFIQGVESSFLEISDYFKDDRILNDEELKSFFKINPSNYQFNKIYELIKSNIHYIKPLLRVSKKEEKTKDILNFNGKINFDKDLTFVNKRVIFDQGSLIILSNNSLVKFEKCDVFIGGEKITSNIVGKDKFSNGSFLFVNSKILIENTLIEGLKPPVKQNPKIPSSITFYDSEIEIKKSTFQNNLEGDDFLNFFRCQNVKITNSIFKNVKSDAIDSDFSNITITKNKFYFTGNDAIDLSGSNSEILKNQFFSTGDKCISIGEASKVISKDNQFNDSEIAIVVKDGSSISSSNNSFKNNKLEYVFFVKKPVYGPPVINSIIENKKTKILKGKYTKINHLNTNDFEIEINDNVESLLYGREYGKSSK